MQSKAAAVTMVRDDLFFLKTWLRHYGGILGRENCYIVNHGRGTDVSELAEGANVIGIPGDYHKKFDMKRWRMLNNVVMALRCYYDHVIVGDVDELVVMDPDGGGDLLDFLYDTRPNTVLTPLGLEVIHRIDLEPEPLTDTVLGPRRFVRPAPHYSKPCIISVGTKIARGGHYTKHDKLVAPPELYLMHLKFCDFDLYSEAMNRRNAVTQSTGASVSEAGIGRHWFSEHRGEDRAVFEAFAELEIQEGFDMAPLRDHMTETWRARGETGYWEFDRPDYETQYQLPERFSGLI